MALTLNESRVKLDPTFDQLLTDLQSNILKHHGRDHAHHLFLSIKSDKVHEAKKWISGFAISKITSAAKQLVDAEIRHEFNIDGGTVFMLSLSSTGYDKLNIQNNIKPDNLAFRDGLKQRNAILEDKTSEWEPGFKKNIDILIIVADSVKSTANTAKNNILTQVAHFAKLEKQQKGLVLKNEHNIGIEHFGYADGVSQPIFLDSEIEQQSAHTQWKDEAKLNLALVKDKGGKFPDSYGSYFVFRKLEQNVKAFKNAEALLPSVKMGNGNANDELAGAMIVGRFEDGTEVTNHDHERVITHPSDLNNDFDYRSDTSGSKCPFHAHIRITNPRADVTQNFAKSVRLVRRGIPYNQINRIGTNGEPTKGVGLLFMCYQRSIESQFEFIQSTWVNQGNIGGHLVGQDGIIGQGENNDQKQLPKKWGHDAPKNNCEFSNPQSGFVKMKGGEYFFTPSISFLKSLG